MTPNPSTIRRAVPLPGGLKARLRRSGVAQKLWGAYRERQLMHEYEERREHYDAAAQERGLVYSEERTTREVRARLAARGYTPPLRAKGEVHTFFCAPMISWHKYLLPDLEELGPVTHFDYTAVGYSAEAVVQSAAAGTPLRDEMLQHVLPALRAAHAVRPVDWVLCYGGGQDTSPAIMREIAETLGIPTVNFSLDDKHGWAGAAPGPWRTGAVDITSSFDLFGTSARVTCEWHMVEGGRPLYMPEGFDAGAFRPRDVPKDLGVTFVGAAYGYRYPVVQYLRDRKVDVTTFGSGWPGAGWADDIVDIFNRSVINLGMGGIEYSEMLTNVKGRDFEIPGTGGGVYLTSFNPDLAQHFVVGEEILCYRNRDEMLELIRYYLRHSDEAAAVAERGRARALREHRWLHRYEKILRILQILPETTTT